MSLKSLLSSVYSAVSAICLALLARRQMRVARRQLRAMAPASATTLQIVSSEQQFQQAVNAVKACYIQAQPTLVYHPVLCQRDPALLTQLRDLAKQQGWQLLGDRRRANLPFSTERRRSLALSLQFIFGSLLLNPATVFGSNASDSSLALFAASGVQPLTQASTVVRPLGLFSPTQNYFAEPTPSSFQSSLLEQLDRPQDPAAPSVDDRVDHFVDPEKYQQVLALFNRKWVKSKADPDYLASDFEDMARYIAAREDAFELVMSLRKQPWTLHHRSGDFRSNVRGNAFSVHSVKIYFDSRAAAILKSHYSCTETAGHCTASPVDALLHELLHAKLALTDTAEFIRHGGMNSLIYPFQHERKVIALENKIYQAMSAKDKIARPVRRAHVGNLIAAGCATCIDS